MESVEVDNILKFQDKLLAHIKANNTNIVEGITKTGIIDENTEKELRKEIENFKIIFQEEK